MVSKSQTTSSMRDVSSTWRSPAICRSKWTTSPDAIESTGSRLASQSWWISVPSSVCSLMSAPRDRRQSSHPALRAETTSLGCRPGRDRPCFLEHAFLERLHVLRALEGGGIGNGLLTEHAAHPRDRD